MADLERELTSLRDRNKDLTDFIENAPISMHSVGADGTILWVNQAELDALGYKREEYVGHHIAEFHADPSAIQDILERLARRETLRGYAARLRAGDGSIRHVLINSNVLWEGDRFLHTRCITRDVTDQIRAAEEISKREELFRAALQDSPIVVFHQNADLRYTWVYNPFPEHTGLSLVNKLDRELFPSAEAEQLDRLKLSVLSNGKGARQELALTTQGQIRIMDVRIEPFRDLSGNLTGILGTAVDITERKRNEQRLIESRARLRNFAAHLQVLREEERELTSREVHDLSQSLTALDMQLSVLAKHFGQGADPCVMAERLQKISGIIGSTIESSARISTHLRPSLLDNVGLAATLEWHAGEFAARTGIRVFYGAWEDVRPDPDVRIAVYRIFEDTLTNVERHSQARRVCVSLREVDGTMVLKLSDNGRGIPRDKLDDPGSFGLFAMRELAIQCHGRIDIQGSSGNGTTVSLEIPLNARMSLAS